MAFQDILDRIIKQAKEEAEQISLNAKQEAESAKLALKAEGEAERKKMSDLTDQKITRALKKAEYLANMEGKNQVLNKKSELINTVLDQVIDKIASIPAKEYEQLLSEILKGIDETEGIIYPALKKENSTKGAVKLAGKNFKMGDSREIKGGFILETKLADLDYSFENLVKKNMIKELEEIIIKEIF